MVINLEGHKLMYHPDRVDAWLRGEMTHPVYVEIGPINACNHKCVFCALDYLKHKGAMIPIERLNENLLDMGRFGVKAVMFAGEGESLIYPHIEEAVSMAKSAGMDVAITTNGVPFTEKKIKVMLKNLSWVKFSIDAGSARTYAEVHKTRITDYNTVLDNMRIANKYRRENKLDCKLGGQFLLIPENKHEVEKFVIDVKSTGVDYAVLKPYSQHPDSINRIDGKLKTDDDDYYKFIVNKYSNKNFNVIYRDATAQEIENDIAYDICYGINFFALMTATGEVIPCNMFYDKPEYSYGNIHKKLFSNIWLGGQRRKVLEMLEAKGCKDCRKGCRLNYVNKYLDALKNNKIEHVNFI